MLMAKELGKGASRMRCWEGRAAGGERRDLWQDGFQNGASTLQVTQGRCNVLDWMTQENVLLSSAVSLRGGARLRRAFASFCAFMLMYPMSCVLISCSCSCVYLLACVRLRSEGSRALSRQGPVCRPYHECLVKRVGATARRGHRQGSERSPWQSRIHLGCAPPPCGVGFAEFFPSFGSHLLGVCSPSSSRGARTSSAPP